MLQASWVHEHADEFDLMHIHFGFDAQTPESLAELTSALRHHAKPLVLTVHDLRNPHHRTQELHEAHLDVLIPAASALITLTPGAAEEIARRWGREATVITHPHVVELDRMARSRPEHAGFVVGVHVKSIRANMDPLPVIEQIADLAAELPGMRLVVDAHCDVMDPAPSNYDKDFAIRVRQLASSGALSLHVHDFYSDAQLWDYLQTLDASVLPYTFGTHSGWLEACFDLGTTTVAPTCGYYAQQRPCLLYDATATDGPASLRAVIQAAYTMRPHWQADIAARAAEREQVAAEHLAIYRSVLAGDRACTS